MKKKIPDRMQARNLTEGSILRNIITFSLPYLLSYFMQILYGMVDLFIVGQYCGVASITAVSIGSQVMHMLIRVLIRSNRKNCSILRSMWMY